MAAVQFLRGTRAAYDAMSSHSNNSLYFCTDTGDLFLGSLLMSDALPKIVGTMGNIGDIVPEYQGVIVGSTSDIQEPNVGDAYWVIEEGDVVPPPMLYVCSDTSGDNPVWVPLHSLTDCGLWSLLATQLGIGSNADLGSVDVATFAGVYDSYENLPEQFSDSGAVFAVFDNNGWSLYLWDNDNQQYESLYIASTTYVDKVVYDAQQTAEYNNLKALLLQMYPAYSNSFTNVLPDTSYFADVNPSDGDVIYLVRGGTVGQTTYAGNTFYVASVDGSTTTYTPLAKAATTSYVDNAVATAVSSAYKFKGSCTYAELPSTGQVVGDVWNVTDAHDGVPAGTNWAWTGTAWDALAGVADLSNYKTKQTAVTDPTASGNAIAFIDSIAQNANGEITVSKKTVPTADGDAVNGPGLISKADYNKFDAAQANVLEGVQINGSDATITNKKVNLVTETAYNPSTNKLATMADVAAVTIEWQDVTES